MSGNEPEHTYSMEGIIAFALIAGIVVCLLFANIWHSDGIITGWFSVERLLCVLAAVAYGGIIGWMLYPRRPFAWVLEPGGLVGFVDSFREPTRRR